MIAQQLREQQFQGYPPEARKVATSNIGLLQQLPLAFLPLLFAEVICLSVGDSPDRRLQPCRRKLHTGFQWRRACSGSGGSPAWHCSDCARDRSNKLSAVSQTASA